MKKLGICIVALALTAGQPRRSEATGIPVVDAVNNLLWAAEVAQNVVRWIDQLERMKDTVENTMSIVKATTSDFNLHEVMATAELVALLPEGAKDFYDTAMEAGAGMYFDRLISSYDATFLRDTCLEVVPAAMSICVEIQMSAYKDEVITDTSADRVALLGNEIEALNVKLAASKTLKQTADIQVLMTGLQAKIQIESMALETVRRKGSDSLRVLEQRQEQVASQVYDLPDFKFKALEFGSGGVLE